MLDVRSRDHRAPSEASALADRLRFAAESLTMEFEGLSSAEAERLIFDVAQEFLSGAQVAQFVPTLATRRARQLLRHRGGEVVIPDTPLEEGSSSLIGIPSAPASREPEPAPPSAPPRPPAYYASEAKRLLEKARALRATPL